MSETFLSQLIVLSIFSFIFILFFGDKVTDYNCDHNVCVFLLFFFSEKPTIFVFFKSVDQLGRALQGGTGGRGSLTHQSGEQRRPLVTPEPFC